MKNHHLVIMLGIYVSLMGIIQYYRSGIVTLPAVIESIGLVTIATGLLLRTGRRAVSIIAVNWVAAIALLSAVMTIGGLGRYGDIGPGAELIFGSMALLSGLTLLIMLMDKRWRKRIRSSSEADQDQSQSR